MCCMGLSPQDGNIGFDSRRGNVNPTCSISNEQHAPSLCGSVHLDITKIYNASIYMLV